MTKGGREYSRKTREGARCVIYELGRLLETGEPDALKGASPVRGGAVGNVPAMATRLPPTPPNRYKMPVSSFSILANCFIG